jgi:FixJ family two-component response regulator
VGEIRNKVAQLTARQRQIMARVVAGRLNKQTAAELGISENTIKVHRRHIMEKMGAGSLADLIHMLGRLG